jgi:phage tail-like protein
VADPAVALRFEVRIDSQELGAFTSCEGLSAEYEIEEYQEGGQNRFVHQLPGRLKYPHVKLTRPVDADSSALAAWFSSLQETVQRQSAQITAYDANRAAVASWNLIGVFPVRWTGPNLSSDGSTVATETLELAHEGFLGAGGST